MDILNAKPWASAVNSGPIINSFSSTEAQSPSFEPDFAEAERFLAHFGESHSFQTFADKAKDKGQMFGQIFHGTLAANQTALSSLNAGGAGVFFMVNGGDGLGRRNENVKVIRAVFVDLDGSPLGPVVNGRLHPSLIVESSSGKYHAYWLIDGDFPLEDFKPVQKNLAAMFNGDKAVNDLARVLRVPGFLHQKKESSRTRVIHESNVRFTLQQIMAAFPLPVNEEKPVSKRKAKVLAKESMASKPVKNLERCATLEEKTDAVYGMPYDEEPRNYEVASYKKAASRCSFLRHCSEEADDLPEGHWYACISNVARCKGGMNICHSISEPHPGYDPEETRQKIEHALSDTGPHTCRYIADDLGFEGCAECEYKGFDTAPVQLGTTRFDDGLSLALERMNLVHAGVLLTNSHRVLMETTGVDGGSELSFLRKEDFFSLYANLNVTTVRDGKLSSVNVAREWFKWPERREYRGVVFSPGKETTGFYNLYRGFSVQPQDGDWSLMDRHIFEVIADGNEAVYNYVLDLMAYLIQNPGGERPGVALVMKGEQGCGKGILMRHFGKLFAPHYLHISDSEHLVGKFNNQLAQAIVVFVDEGTWGGDKASEGKLKALITEPTHMIEAKGRDAVAVENHVNVFIASNNDWVVPAGRNERRFFVVDVSSRYMQNVEYFGRLEDQMNNGGREAMMANLLKRKVSLGKLRRIPRTDALTGQIIRSLDSIGKFWHDRLTRGRVVREFYTPPSGRDREERFEMEWPKTVGTQHLYQQYIEYCKEASIRHPEDARSFGKKLKGYCPDVGKSKAPYGLAELRVNVYTLPSLSACRAAFSKQIGSEVDWPEECFEHVGGDQSPRLENTDLPDPTEIQFKL